MAYYQRGKFANAHRVVVYDWNKAKTISGDTQFVETLIVRGIGYRTFALNNDFLAGGERFNKSFIESTRPLYTVDTFGDDQEISFIGTFEFPKKRYITVRAGHTRDMYIPLHRLMQCTTSKKDRKLSIASIDKILAANLARKVYLYRAPSVYTGRGVRIKHVKLLRKAGKKDKQRGKAF